MGGPANQKEINNFLYNLFRDPLIIQLPKFLKPFQVVLAWIIANRRTPKVAKLYSEIGGGSPIQFETAMQAKALEKRMGMKVYHAMRYTKPFLKEVLEDMKAHKVHKLSVIPLYPQYSIATTGSSFHECKQMFKKSGFSNMAKIKYARDWHTDASFVELLQDRVRDSIKKMQEKYTKLPADSIYLLYSAHGLPQKYVDRGDPYQKQIEKSVELVQAAFPDNEHMISYQSKVGPVKWLEPNTEDVVIDLARRGVTHTIVIPISFVGDHIETMHEIAIEYKELAIESGMIDFIVARPPKANPKLIDALVNAYHKLNPAEKAKPKPLKTIGVNKSLKAEFSDALLPEASKL
jgi:ferrochelatase